MIFENAGTVMPVWRIHRVDPGYLYIIQSHSMYKIGKTVHSTARLRAARTWLPDMEVVGIKPFWQVSYPERALHAGFARHWYDKEWFEFKDEEGVQEVLVDGFRAFRDDDPDRNSVDFIYWFNGEGMAEFFIEMARQKLSLPKFQKQESDRIKGKALRLKE